MNTGRSLAAAGMRRGAGSSPGSSKKKKKHAGRPSGVAHQVAEARGPASRTRARSSAAVRAHRGYGPWSGLIVVAIGSSAQFNPELAVKPIIDAVQDMPTGAPVVAFPLPIARESMAMLEAAHIPCFSTVESCADSISLFLSGGTDNTGQTSHSNTDQKAVEKALHHVITKKQSGVTDGLFNEVDSHSIFSAIGMTGPRQSFIPSHDDLHAIAPQRAKDDGLRYPLVAKLVSSDLPHKSEHGAIILDIADAAELSLAVEAPHVVW